MKAPSILKENNKIWKKLYGQKFIYRQFSRVTARAKNKHHKALRSWTGNLSIIFFFNYSSLLNYSYFSLLALFVLLIIRDYSLFRSSILYILLVHNWAIQVCKCFENVDVFSVYSRFSSMCFTSKQFFFSCVKVYN